MPYILGFKLSERDEKILEFLFSYRGITAKQLIILLLGKSLYSLSEEKSVYNSLRKLKNQGLVSSHRLQDTVTNGSMYYLSPKGYNLMLDLLNIETEQQGQGWLPHGGLTDDTFADISYEIYSPPKKQTAHHLMLIDFFLRIRGLSNDVVEGFPHRSNIYSSQKFHQPVGNRMQTKKFRPDGEVMINSRRYTVEIDRAMETHEQLVQKFEVYKAYFEHCKRNKEFIPIQGILFVVEDRRRMHGIKKRWASLLAAYAKTLYPEWRDIPLILTTMSSAADTILDESSILSTGNEGIKKTMQVWLRNKFNVSSCVHYSLGEEQDLEYSYTIGLKDDSTYDIYNGTLCHEYDTRLFTAFTDLQKNIAPQVKEKPSRHTEGRRFHIAKTMISYPEHLRKPVVVDVKPYGVDPQLSYLFKEASKLIEFCWDSEVRGDKVNMFSDDDYWT